MINYETRVRERLPGAVARCQVYRTLYQDTVLWFIDNNGETIGSAGSEQEAWRSAFIGICLKNGLEPC
jgi:hypothetical protein